MTERQLADELHREVKEIIGSTEASLVQHFLQAFLSPTLNKMVGFDWWYGVWGQGLVFLG